MYSQSEDGNFMKGFMVAILLSIPLWVLFFSGVRVIHTLWYKVVGLSV